MGSGVARGHSFKVLNQDGEVLKPRTLQRGKSKHELKSKGGVPNKLGYGSCL